MLPATFAMTVARLNEWWIDLKSNATTQATPANDHVSLLRDANTLDFSEEAKRFFATFAADPASFHSAKRDTQIPRELEDFGELSHVCATIAAKRCAMISRASSTSS